MSGLLVEAMVCPHCEHIDDLAPVSVVDPDTGERTWLSQRCPCPHDEVTAATRAREVARRHRVAVERVRISDRWAQMRAERRAS